MRILVVSQYFWPENFRINDLVRGLRERGHDVVILTGFPNYPGGRFFYGYRVTRQRDSFEGAQVLRVPIVPRFSGRGWQLAVNYFSFVISACILGPFLVKGGFDTVFVFETSPVTVGIPAIMLGRLKHAPVLFWVLDLWPESLSAAGKIHARGVLRVAAKLVRFIYRRCARILISSNGFRSSVEAHGGNPASIRYFPNWAEDVYISAPSDVEPVPGLPRGFRVMFAGNIGAAQDFETILSAAEAARKADPSIQWLIVGEGRMGDWVRREAEKRGLSNVFHMMGPHPAENMPAFYAAADVMLVILRPESIFALTVPGKLQSYLAFGKPIIAAADGETAKIVLESGSGSTCPAGDAKALAELVIKMRNMTAAERVQMGESGRRYCRENFDRRMLIDRLESWMRELHEHGA